jgi:hypothetical protein
MKGVRQRALLIPDLESLGDVRCLETQSDVFALHQKEVCSYILLVKIGMTRQPEPRVYRLSQWLYQTLRHPDASIGDDST